MDEELEVLWKKCEESIKMNIRKHFIELIKLGVESKVYGAFCAEGGWMIGNDAFDIRAFGWSPSHGKNWYQHVRFGTDFGSGKVPESSIKRVREIANEMVADVQKVWDEGIKSL